jgi:hypothetical protein
MGLITSFPGGNGGSEITVDSELSTTSENPVQNKVITTELNKKANSDDIPTKLSQLNGDSTHRTVSDTEKNAWSGKQDALTPGNGIDITNNVISAGIPIVANQFEKSDLYSTTEKVVGCWTDGRPLYQKTYEVVLGTANDMVDVAVTFETDLSKQIKNYSGIVYASNFIRPIPQAWGSADDKGPQYKIFVFQDSTGFQLIHNRSTLGGLTSHITIQYTKTTDAANSFKYADENDYSTTEHIVGTWIDGKPVYQKTIDCGALPNSTNKSIAHGISNFKQLIGLKGNAKSSANFIVIPHESPYDSSTGEYSVGCYVTTTNIVLQTKQNLSSYTASYVTIQYTKTTD